MDSKEFLQHARIVESAHVKSKQHSPKELALKALSSYWAFIDLIKFKGGSGNFGDVHRELVQFITEPQTKCVGNFKSARINQNFGRRRLVLIPRGHLKSTLCSVGYTLWRIYRNPNIRICVATATKDLALQFVREIKQYLENEDLQDSVWNVRPHIKGRLVPVLDKAGARRRDRLRADDYTEAEDKKIVWRSDAIQVLRSDLMKEPTVLAASPGSNITGMHFDLLIKDDIINDDSVATESKMEKTLEWSMDLESVLDPQRKVFIFQDKNTQRDYWEVVGDEDLVLGTRYGKGDYYEYILENKIQLGYEVFFRNIFKNGVDLEEGYLWPEKFNDFVVQNLKKRQSPRRFASQYLNSIIVEEEQLLKWSNINWISECSFDIHPGYIHIFLKNKERVQVVPYLVIDPAISQKKNADSSVLVVGGLDSERNLYILDVRYGKFTPEYLIGKLFELADKWKIYKVVLEVVAFQQVLSHMIRSSFGRYRPIGIIEYRPKGEKRARITSMLEPYFVNNRVYCSRLFASIGAFKEEIEYFRNDPNNRAHDDFLDAIAILAEVATPSSKPSFKDNFRSRYSRFPINTKYGGLY